MAAADAHKLGVRDGDTVEITSRFGSVSGKAAIDEGLRPGVLFAAFYDAKLLVNLAVADHFDPISKEPEYKVTAVKARKV
jgi:nitrate reductase NapA